MYSLYIRYRCCCGQSYSAHTVDKINYFNKIMKYKMGYCVTASRPRTDRLICMPDLTAH